MKSVSIVYPLYQDKGYPRAPTLAISSHPDGQERPQQGEKFASRKQMGKVGPAVGEKTEPFIYPRHDRRKGASRYFLKCNLMADPELQHPIGCGSAS